MAPAPSPGTSFPYDARSCATRTISWAPSWSTSARIESGVRLRCGPRNDGIAQNPHVRSQPSAIFTYAQGAEAGGRGRLSRSRDGAAGPAFTVSDTGTPNPATVSTSGSASASSLPYRSARQPVTTMRAPVFARGRQRQDRVDRLLASLLDERARVHHHEVGLVDGFRRLQAIREQRADELVGVDLVLRAAQGLDVEPLGHARKATGPASPDPGR